MTADKTPTPRTALDQFNEFAGEDKESPLERLRFFCSIAMQGQDWLDVEQFFIAVETELAAKTLELAEAKAEAERLREDAERYRWLKERADEVCVTYSRLASEDECYSGKALDAAIDAARAQGGERERRNEQS